ncbi:molybdopterin-dependent oxidoreductase [Haloarcula onubensis]|uniref:Molybdopterin-dependent oxidoreductase n=1 Tax=Haloarcula onubensis TaxID=2950539 RepID=A0ABU2FRX6_9EURY|nr:molybdopterin-dependent oxidoreductase [Halomicroarcula sp. S3CR25-11]MDS0283524.1 molybdopterin-dependent oxidoreductase [Halomicroarcula sp. S3CR25-11]
MNDALLDSRGGQLLAGLAAGAAGVAGSYAATGSTPAFVASPVERTLSRTMPGEIVTFAIETLGSLGQQLNLLTAVVLVWLLFATGITGAILAGRRANNRVVPTLGTAVVTWLVTAGLTGRLVLALGPVVPSVAVVALAQAFDAYRTSTDPISSKRRRALSTVGVALGATAVGVGVGWRRTSTGGTAPSLEGQGVDDDDVQAKLDTAEERSFDIDGIEPLVSENFYEVDINAVDPNPTVEEYTLSITGAVESEVTVDYDELREMNAVNQFSTLRCVGDSLNGSKIDTALWTGVPLRRLVERAGVRSDCDCVLLKAEDGYEVEFPMEAFNRGLAVYGMNGNKLPRGHGYPVRAVIPGHWGEVNTKWLTEIELLNREVDGYWEQRGWEGTGPVKPTATLKHDAILDSGERQLAGHAYAGLRGVSKVEVSTDGGDSWSEATLSEPLPAAEGDGPAQDAWRQWQYSYDPPGSTHTAVVRMVDRDGNVQTSEETGPVPTGPSGWVTKEFQS